MDMIDDLIKKHFCILGEIEIKNVLSEIGSKYFIKSTKYNLTLDFTIDYNDNSCSLGYSKGIILYDTEKIDFNNYMLIDNNKSFQKSLAKFLFSKYGHFQSFKGVNDKIEGYLEFMSKYFYENLTNIIG
jgi:hypothetical protein